jgi:uncharacterized protein with von Willebrand factor type A (vWA) domain
LTNCIEKDRLDELSFERNLERTPNLQNSIETRTEDLRTVPELAQDFYNALHQYKPKLKDEVPSSHQLNRQLDQNMMASSDYGKLRTYTRGNEFESALATSIIMDNVLENVPKEKLEAVNRGVEQAEQLQAEAQDLLKEINRHQQDLGGDELNNPEWTQNELDGFQAELNSVQQQLQQVDADIGEVMDEMGLELRQTMRQAAKQAMDDVDGFTASASAWGLEAGQLKQASFEDKLELHQLLKDNEGLDQIAELIGRLKRVANKQRSSRSRKTNKEFVGVESGDDLGRVLPSELMLLHDPRGALLFAKRWKDKQLIQYKTGGTEQQGRGAIICCVDESGSMEGLRLVYAKALALTLADVAERENRPFVAISFGYKDELKIWDELNSIQQKVAFAQHFYDGGTDFERPLTEAIGLILSDEAQGKPFKKADIVFITDGDCRVSDEFLQSVKKFQGEVGFQIHSIAVGHDARPQSLQKFSDQVHSLLDLREETKKHTVSGAILGSVL